MAVDALHINNRDSRLNYSNIFMCRALCTVHAIRSKCARSALRIDIVNSHGRQRGFQHIHTLCADSCQPSKLYCFYCVINIPHLLIQYQRSHSHSPIRALKTTHSHTQTEKEIKIAIEAQIVYSSYNTESTTHTHTAHNIYCFQLLFSACERERNPFVNKATSAHTNGIKKIKKNVFRSNKRIY